MKQYYFKEKLFKFTDQYWIIDENGEKCFYLDQDLKLIGYSATVFNTKQVELFTISRQVISLLPRYFVNFSDGTSIEINARFSFFRKVIDVATNFGDIVLKGDVWDFNFAIYIDDELIGEIVKKPLTLTDTYELTVYAEKYTLASLALVICLNNIKDGEKARH